MGTRTDCTRDTIQTLLRSCSSKLKSYISPRDVDDVSRMPRHPLYSEYMGRTRKTLAKNSGHANTDNTVPP